MLGNINAAGAALHNWVINLHKGLAGTGIQAAHVAIGVWIGTGGPAGASTPTPEQIAPVYWDLYTSRDEAERFFTVWRCSCEPDPEPECGSDVSDGRLEGVATLNWKRP